MFDNTKEPLYADFNEMGDDGAVVMGAAPFDDIHLQQTDFVPTEGTRVWISDGDIEETGVLALREAANGNKYWVSITDRGSTKDVPKDAWYHNDNLQRR
jgi:hypothetical protein